MMYMMNLDSFISPPHVTIRQMKSQWGLAADLGKITLNSSACDCIIYEDQGVVVKLAHFIEANHSKAFWDVVRRFEPEYKDRRRVFVIFRLNSEFLIKV